MLVLAVGNLPLAACRLPLVACILYKTSITLILWVPLCLWWGWGYRSARALLGRLVHHVADGCSCSCSRIPFLSLRSDELPGFDFFSFRIFLVIDKPQDVCIARIKLLHLGRQPSQTRHRLFITDRAVGFSVPRFLPVFCFRRRHRHGEIRR